MAATLATLRELQSTGQHQAVIAQCSAALAGDGAGKPLAGASRLALLDFRAESSVALGRLADAEADARSMLGLAQSADTWSLKAPALNRTARVQMLQGHIKKAVTTARAALAAAERSRQKPLIAASLLVLGEAQSRTAANEPAMDSAERAVGLFRELDDLSGEGRAHWITAYAASNLGRPAEVMEAGTAALECCRKAGDAFGAGNALNMLIAKDVGQQIDMFTQALTAFERAGYVERQGMIKGNLAGAYARLGLFHRSRRLYAAQVAMAERTGAQLSLTYAMANLTPIELEMGDIARASALLERLEKLLAIVRDPLISSNVVAHHGLLAMEDGKPAAAIPHFERALQLARKARNVGARLITMSLLARARLAVGDTAGALAVSTEATDFHRASGLMAIVDLAPQELWWEHARGLFSAGRTGAAHAALDIAYDQLLATVASVHDTGLRRNCLNKPKVHRQLLAAWLEEGGKRKLPKERLLAHLMVETNPRAPFRRLADTGLRLNALRSTAELTLFLVDEATELSGGERVLLIVERDGRREVANALLPKGETVARVLRAIEPHLDGARLTRSALLVHTPASGPTVRQRSRIVAPLVAGTALLGYLYVDMDGLYGRFDETDRDMMGMLANQGAVALENAQWSAELEAKVEQRTTELQASNATLGQRNAELAIINSIQQGLAAEVGFQAIVDLVGDRLREVFRTPDLGINWYDEKTNLIRHLYVFEHGRRIEAAPRTPTPGGSFEIMRSTRQPVILATAADFKRVGFGRLPGTSVARSVALVPIISADRVVGSIVLENHEREHAFGPADLRVVSTIAASLGTALENARLFEETQRLFKAEQDRVAELEIINSIQRGLAAEMQFHSIVDLVGDKLREVFATPDLGITWYEERNNVLHYLYQYEHGKRLPYFAQPPSRGGVFETMRRDRRPVVLRTSAEMSEAGSVPLPGTDLSKSMISVPVISGDRVLGDIAIENYERENAFGDSELRLLTTIAASLGTALQNARLFDETQRLFKAEQERAAELQIINSIQQGLASKLDLQAIIDLVGDKLRAILDSGDIGIRLQDRATGLIHYMYEVEHGQRIEIAPLPPSRLFQQMCLDREPVFGPADAIMARLGLTIVAGTDPAKAIATVPIIAGNDVIGAIVVENFEREDFFNESNIRLMQTIAGSMGVALENARLFDETQRLFKAEQQRAAELEVISSIQQGVAASLDFQNIINLVGDKMGEVLQTRDIGIRWFDHKNRMVHYMYEYEHGRRLSVPPQKTSDQQWERLNTRCPARVNNTAAEVAAGGLLPGTDCAQSNVAVQIMGSDRVLGSIMVENYERENAFGESDVRLLTTVASSMGVALENARLFDETQRLLKETEQRNAELAIINSVQQALAAELNIQGIYDAVGDKIRDIFSNTDMNIRIYDPKSNFLHYPYVYEDGKRIEVRSAPLTEFGFSPHVLRTRETVVINANLEEEEKKYGGTTLPGTLTEKSLVFVPLISGDQVRGMINLANAHREHAFSESDVRLLQTLANSMSVALENARLFDETQRLLKETEQRNAELAIINSVQEGLASKLEMQAIYDLVGEKLRELFDSQGISIVGLDAEKDLRHYHFLLEKGRRFEIADAPIAPVGRHIMATRQPLLVNRNLAQTLGAVGVVTSTLPGTEPTRSMLRVPIMVGADVRGVIGLDNVDREDAFTDSDVRLLTTLASCMSVALENARLFEETKQNAAELATINTVSQALSSEIALKNLLHLVGEQMRTIFHADVVYVALLDEAAQVINFPYAHGEAPGSLRLGEGLTSKIIESGKPLLLNQDLDNRASELGASRVGLQSKSYLGVPIFVGRKAIGVISVQSMQAEGQFDQSDLRLLTTIAGNVGSAIHNARLFDEAQQARAEAEESRAAAEQASNAKSTFLANMSHELRTPLNAIIGVTEMLQEDAKEFGRDDEFEPLERVVRAGRHLLALINDILDLSKIEAGKMELHVESFPLKPLIADVGTTIATLAQKNGNRVVIDCPDAIGQMVGDQTRIRQALLNLASNATKFTDKGTVTISARREAKAGRDWMILAVADTGIGLTPVQMSRLFQEFVQADASTTRKYGGTGLGLVISRRFCQMMGGDITVASVPGAGSVFTMTVPAETGAIPVAPAGWSPQQHASAAPPHGGTVVLVIDDDESVRSLTERFLSRDGFAVVTAPDGTEGLRMVRELHPAAVILDVMMPGIDGWTVLAAMKGDPALADIPVIMMTILDEKTRGYALGATDYMVKPADRSQLTATLRRICGPHDNRVLVVDDDAFTREAVQRTLMQDGWSVTVADNGRTGLEQLALAPPDVIMLDLMMPEMDGFEFLDAVRHSAQWRDIPVLVVTAKDLTADDHRRLNGGVASIIIKSGVEPEALLREICAALDRNVRIVKAKTGGAR